MPPNKLDKSKKKPSYLKRKKKNLVEDLKIKGMND